MPPVVMQMARYLVACDNKEPVPPVVFVAASFKVRGAADELGGVRLDPELA
jgi:hypothetical protein